MQALNEAPIPAHDPDIESRGRAWLRFLRTTNAMYENLAEERGEPYRSLLDEEMTAVAHLAASFGIEPADAVARVPFWCTWRFHLQHLRQRGITAS